MQAVGAEESLVGLVFADKYRITCQIGRGGMGVVYEAEHLHLGKRVAIKLMLEKYAQDGEATARFHREARAASRIGNPHIIDVIDTGTAPDGRAFVVMELLNGSPLSNVIEMSGSIPPWRSIQIMRQVLRAVGAAHAKGIIHRDLKPDNIFLVNDGGDQHDFVKLLDFGISKMTDIDEQIAFTKLTTTGVVMGTPLYMAPEQAMGHPSERYADIYACGVILYEMLAGKPPFEGQTYAVLVAKLLTQDPPLLSALRPGLPPALVSAVHRALEKEPKARFQTAEQFLLALPGEKTPSLIELAGTLDSSSGAVAISPPTTMKGRIGEKKKWPLFAVLAALVVAAGTVMFVALQNNEPKPATTPTAAPIANTASASPIETGSSAQKSLSVVATGKLQIRSMPPGAKVTIDGIDRGLTPTESTLEVGRHKVKIELAGYVTVEEEEEVREQERTSVVLPLQKTSEAPIASKRTKPDIKKTTKIEPIAADPKTDAKKPNGLAEPFDTKTEPPVKTDPPKSKGGAKPNPY
ncbi:MAG: protein kinase [Myxococcota bacterium]|nr:protein kinase [Myxococcota bacterium]